MCKGSAGRWHSACLLAEIHNSCNCTCCGRLSNTKLSCIASLGPPAALLASVPSTLPSCYGVHDAEEQPKGKASSSSCAGC